MNRKGDLTASEVIGLVLLIIGFVLVLMFFTVLNLEGGAEDKVCHLSVLSRASITQKISNFIPLKCTTSKICLTDSLVGGDCDEFAGEKKVDNIRVSKEAEEGANKIEETIAKEMYYCWKELGEGKVDLFNGVENPETIYGQAANFINVDNQASTCIVCARIAVDNAFDKNALEGIRTKIDVAEYMQKTNIPDGKKSYLEAFSGGLKSYPAEFTETFGAGTEIKKGETDEIAVIFMQFIAKDAPLKLFGEKTTKSAAFMFTSHAAISGFGMLKQWPALLAEGASALAIGGFAAYEQNQKQNLAAGYCGDFIGDAQEARKGCSIILPIDYENIEKVNQFCGRIEGSP